MIWQFNQTSCSTSIKNDTANKRNVLFRKSILHAEGTRCHISLRYRSYFLIVQYGQNCIAIYIYIYISFEHLGIQTDSNWKDILQTHCCGWQSIRNAHWIQVYKKPTVQWNSNHYLLSRFNAHLRFYIWYVRALLFHMVLSLITFDFGSDFQNNYVLKFDE